MSTGLRGDLGGRVVLVTGAAQGVGGAVARRAAEWGANIVLADRNADGAARIEAEIAGRGGRCATVIGDLADPAYCAHAIAAADAKFGGLDGLVNAAALTDRGSLLDTAPDFIDRMLAINLRAPFLLMQGAARLMRRDGREGAVVNILSVNAHCGGANLTAYSASKGGLATLTRNAANALARDRIRVNGIYLGWTDTPHEHEVQRAESAHGEDWLAQAAAAQPFGRLIDVEELADLIAFLLSRHAGVMTGALIDYGQQVPGALHLPGWGQARTP